jgi:limonene-1,2-epoxide hydrolase
VRFAPLLLAALVLAGCAGHKPASPEQVARTWSAALDRNDNKAAGALFAKDARVVQDTVLVLHGSGDAERWNEALPCGGAIVGVSVQKTDEVLVVFRLQHRPQHACDGPGRQAAAVFRVDHGKIVLWHQVPPPSPGTSV